MAESLGREAVERRFLSAGRIGLIGPAAEAVDERLRTAAAQLTTAGDHYAELARECWQRATVCDDYAAAVARHRSLPLVERMFVSQPERPAPWADA